MIKARCPVCSEQYRPDLGHSCSVLKYRAAVLQRGAEAVAASVAPGDATADEIEKALAIYRAHKERSKLAMRRYRERKGK